MVLRLILLLLITELCTGNVLRDNIQHLKATERGYYGNIVPYGTYAWMVTLQKSDVDTHFCVGAILSEHWIIMSAHCIEPIMDYETYTVIVGMYNPFDNDLSKLQRVGVAGVATPPKDGINENDIALLYTTEPINIRGSNGTVSPIRLPQPYSEPKGFSKVIGWGPAAEGSITTLKLLDVTIPIYSRELCTFDDTNNIFKGRYAVPPHMMCGGMTGEYECKYVSGGPIFQMEDGFATLIGLISWGSGCGEKYFPGGIYTKISSYTPWIKSTMETVTMGK